MHRFRILSAQTNSAGHPAAVIPAPDLVHQAGVLHVSALPNLYICGVTPGAAHQTLHHLSQRFFTWDNILILNLGQYS
jgi:hypothetical protein